jgi:hypothetical protein
MSTTVYSILARSIARKLALDSASSVKKRLTDRLGHVGLKHSRTSRNAR